MPLLQKICSSLKFQIHLLQQYLLAIQPWQPAKRELARRNLALYFLNHQADAITFSRQGLTWTAPPGDVVARHLFLYGSYELERLDALLGWLQQHHGQWHGSTSIINIGANIGATCIPLTLKTQKRCIACEPVPGTFKLLKSNIETNQLDQLISCHSLGISSTKGVVEMAITGDTGWSEVRTENGNQGFTALSAIQDYIPCEMITLEDLLLVENLAVEKIGLVWSDTQGYESEVINSGRKLWAAGVPLWLEVWLDGLAAHGGLEKFKASVEQNFQYFLTQKDLANPVDRFPRNVRSLDSLLTELESQPYKSTDILLIP